MIAALNLIPLVLLIAAGWAVFKRNRIALAAVALLAVVYVVAQPSYLPKGTVERSPVPPLAPSEAAIQDRTRQPDTLQERDQRMQEAVSNGLDFKKSP